METLINHGYDGVPDLLGRDDARLIADAVGVSVVLAVVAVMVVSALLVVLLMRWGRARWVARRDKLSRTQQLAVDVHEGQVLDDLEGMTTAEVVEYMLKVFRTEQEVLVKEVVEQVKVEIQEAVQPLHDAVQMIRDEDEVAHRRFVQQRTKLLADYAALVGVQNATTKTIEKFRRDIEELTAGLAGVALHLPRADTGPM